MNKDFFEALDDLELKRGISKEYMLTKIKAALENSFKKEYPACNAIIDIDEKKQDVKVFMTFDVVEEVIDPKTQISLDDAKKIKKTYKVGDIYKKEVKTKDFGRNAALNAKNVIIQAVREAERTNQIREYEKRKEEVISAVVVRSADTDGNVVIQTETGEAMLRKEDQIPGETFDVGDHIKVFVTSVSKDNFTDQIVSLSRVHPGLVKRLLELEVPEIADGVVIIKSVAREAGSRTKVAVYSRDENVDAVGACIGNKGNRIANIVDELRDEKIDVIQYSAEPEEYIAAALSPASINSVSITDGEKSARVLVDPDQLSLAIGKEGQNARLAARLTGYKIDIKS